MANIIPLPDNVQLDGAPAPSPAAGAAPAGAPAAGPQFVPLADNVQLDDPTAPPPDDGSFWANAATGIARIPGAIIGIPHALESLGNSLRAGAKSGFSAADNAAYNLKHPNDPIVDGQTAASLDAADPLQKLLPSSQGVDSAVFGGINALDRAAGGAGSITPYQPRTSAGQVLQAGITAAGAGAVDPMADAGMLARAWDAVRNFGAGAGATVAQQAFPNSPLAPIAGAILAHGGATAAGAGTRVAAPVIGDTFGQVFTPTRAGTAEAGRTLADIDHSPAAGLVQPSPGDLAGALGDVQAATSAIGPGLEPWQAGRALRQGLQSRADALTAARQVATAPLAAARDASTAPVNLDPVVNTIAGKLATAAGPQADAISGALSDLQMPSGVMRSSADQLAASRQAINSRITAATRVGDDATASHLLDIRNALDQQVNAVVPEAGQFNQTYAAMSRPLDPTQYGAVGDVLDRDQFNSRYLFPESRIPDLFLRSPATREDLNQLVASFGGDKNAALGALQQHLAGVAQKAVNADGTLDPAAFTKAMAPYQKSLGSVGMWFPKLAQQFSTAKGAQSALDTMNAQRELADDVATGGLRDLNGNVNGPSINRWLYRNRNALANTNDPSAAMRLKSIAAALNDPSGEIADALRTETLPMVVGGLTGGAEGGVLGGIAHKSSNPPPRAVLR